LADALTGLMEGIHHRLPGLQLDRIELIDRQIEELNKPAAAQMQTYHEALMRLIEVPGIGAKAAQEIVAEIGPKAAARTNGTHRHAVFERFVLRPGNVKAIWGNARSTITSRLFDGSVIQSRLRRPNSGLPGVIFRRSDYAWGAVKKLRLIVASSESGNLASKR